MVTMNVYGLWAMGGCLGMALLSSVAQLSALSKSISVADAADPSAGYLHSFYSMLPLLILVVVIQLVTIPVFCLLGRQVWHEFRSKLYLTVGHSPVKQREAFPYIPSHHLR